MRRGLDAQRNTARRVTWRTRLLWCDRRDDGVTGPGLSARLHRNGEQRRGRRVQFSSCDRGPDAELVAVFASTTLALLMCIAVVIL